MKDNSRDARIKYVIIGRPNVGKSSLYNRIVGKRQAIVHDVAGTTRDIISEKIICGEKSYELFDTAGYAKEKGSELSEAAISKVKEAIDFADGLVFVVDGTVMPTAVDIQIADLARKSKKKTVLIINKIDNPKIGFIPEYEKLGFKDIFPTSVIHNVGVDSVKESLEKGANKNKDREAANKQIRISVVGRPNVGKSSLLNSILKKERAIVSDIPGTTRDVVSGELTSEDFEFRISDTAGARKPGKIGMAAKRGEPVEKYSYLRTQKEVENSDIILVVLDASQKIAAQDLHIAGDAKELGKGIILVINKWDLVKETQQDKFLNRLRRQFNFMIWVPAIFVSAKTGRNVDEIIQILKKVHENQTREIPTSKLNRILEDFILTNPPRGVKNMRPKMFFVAQTGKIPPTYTVSAKFHAFVHFAWRRALENELRRHFDFTGTPIKIIFKAK